jgi:hypothetical protein
VITVTFFDTFLPGDVFSVQVHVLCVIVKLARIKVNTSLTLMGTILSLTIFFSHLAICIGNYHEKYYCDMKNFVIITKGL